MQNLYLFNSDNEMAIANGKESYTPPATIVKMMQDLSFLPAFYADQGDYILLKNALSLDFRRVYDTFSGIGELGVTWEEVKKLSLNELRPWGWSPRIHQVLKELKPNCSESFVHSVMGEWYTGREDWYSRKKVVDLMQVLKKRMDFSAELLPVVCESVAAVKGVVREGDVVVKSP